jgi:hypothetical protein
MPSPCQTKHSSVRARTRAIALLPRRCSQPSAWLAIAALLGWPPDRTFAPPPDDRKLFDRPIVIYDATLSLSMTLRSWTSQLL